ncbi:MAG: XTP/dITP diphosphatase [Firmicutes bacterium]|nr:XTP/dITP diphosphatase [Bacillota bacterium]
MVIASRNEHKIEEIRRLLAGLDVDVLSLKDYPDAPEVDEDGAAFQDNALKKARVIARFTGLTALADDSGLEVDSLGGQPGVRSARFAGETASDAENNRKLLRCLAEVPSEERQAQFRCVIALVSRTGAESLVEGTCQGVIIEKERGSGGFGYDPLFLLPHLGKTFAELSMEEKNELSHRGKALQQVLPIVQEWLEQGLV